MEYLNQSELLSVLSVARKHSTRDWLMILFCYNHGLRREEVCKIRLGDIRDSTLAVERLKGSKATIQPLTAHRGQPLLDEVKGLKVWLAERPKDSGDALFPSEKGHCMTGGNFARIFARYALWAGLPEAKRHPHVLKHAAITHLIQGGLDIAQAQVFAGHRSITSTLKYTHLQESDVSEKVQNVRMSIF